MELLLLSENFFPNSLHFTYRVKISFSEGKGAVIRVWRGVIPKSHQDKQLYLSLECAKEKKTISVLGV